MNSLMKQSLKQDSAVIPYKKISMKPSSKKRTHRPSLSSSEEKSRNTVGVLENVPGINFHS